MQEFQCDIRIDAPSGPGGDACGTLCKHSEPQFLIFEQSDLLDVAVELEKNRPQIEVDENGGLLLF